MGGGPVVEWIRDGVGFTPAAVRSFKRLERAVVDWLGRPVDTNSTARDYDEQMGMYLAWQRYVNSGYNPALYPGHSRALHPDESVHTKAEALDSDDWRVNGFIALAAERGWIRTAANDPTEQHHFEYIANRDQHRNDPVPEYVDGYPYIPKDEEEEDEMKTSGIHWTRSSDGAAMSALVTPGSGFATVWEGGSGEYHGPIAKAFDTSDWAPVSESHALAILRDVAKVNDVDVAGTITLAPVIDEGEVTPPK